jgi:hypothetical protein
MNPTMWSGVLREETLIPEHVLPVQFQDVLRRKRAVSPEISLVIAILERAILDLREYRFARRRREQRLYMNAYAWVASDDRRWPYSFSNLCEALNLNPLAVRTQLLGESAPAGPPAFVEWVPEVSEAA